ncbi:hypothetical protein F4809DRAFT_642869 [Biscogniauxia mediterranea]|nr:hypothetical protein F4809DRAFT_642869 [Biscogniauxia mediterranea]
MASSYALPDPSLLHDFDRDHSPSSFGQGRSGSSLSSISVSSQGHGYPSDHLSINEDNYGHSRRNTSHYRTNSLLPLQRRENRPSPLRLNAEELPTTIITTTTTATTMITITITITATNTVAITAMVGAILTAMIFLAMPMPMPMTAITNTFMIMIMITTNTTIMTLPIAAHWHVQDLLLSY